VFRACCLCFLALALGARGHPEIEAALARFDGLITASPQQASLYLERGELHARHNDLMAADRDFRRAAELSAELPRLDRARGALALAKGQLLEARRCFNQALARDSSDAEALVLRAKVQGELGERGAALADLNAGLARIAVPSPDLYLTRAGLHADRGSAIRSLDEGIERLGPVPALVLRAFMLEQADGRTDAALARLDAIIARSERKETWLKMRGDLLARAGRAADARASYAAAHRAVDALPDWLQQSPDVVKLRAELETLSR
jgi:tetratricopeptide (TPR) repeat protein